MTEPFQPGETVYHRIDGKGQIIKSEWGDLMFLSGDGWMRIASVASDLSRQPWPATPTQETTDERKAAIYAELGKAFFLAWCSYPESWSMESKCDVTALMLDAERKIDILNELDTAFPAREARKTI